MNVTATSLIKCPATQRVSLIKNDEAKEISLLINKPVTPSIKCPATQRAQLIENDEGKEMSLLINVTVTSSINLTRNFAGSK